MVLYTKCSNRKYNDSKTIEKHDAIVTKLLLGAVAFKKPWITYTCGAYGSGKSHTIKHLKFLQTGMVHIDPDAIKTLLADEKNAPVYLADEKNTSIHLEATFVSTLAEFAVFHRGLSAIIDGSLHNYVWYEEYLSKQRLKYPAYNWCLVHVDCNLQTALTRCAIRGKETKRTIPEDLVAAIHAKIPTALVKLQSHFDCIVMINNQDKTIIKEVRLHSVVRYDKEAGSNGTLILVPPFLLVG